jgi:hypothetical protein
MKKLFLIAITCFAATIAYSQDNPYAIFGYKVKQPPKPSPIDIYTVINHDTKSNIKYMIVNHEDKIIKLLDDRDSIISTIPYTDKDIFRWTSTDPMATKYPSMSPYNYAGNNPIKNIDIGGDSIRTTGNAAATAAYKQTAEAGMGNIATMNQAANGNWTLSPLTDDQQLSMTGPQADMYRSLSNMISDTKTASFSLIDASSPLSSQVLIGDNGAAPAGYTVTPGVHTIDMGDVKNMGTTGVLTSYGALMHETSEGFAIQTQGKSGTAAHFDTAIPTESAVNGVTINLSRTSAPTVGGSGNIQTVTIPVTVNGVQRNVTITFTNGNIQPFGVSNNNRP